MRELVTRISSAMGKWAGHKISDVQLIAEIQAALDEQTEYVTLDSVLGRGRHEEESGVDLAAERRAIDAHITRGEQP